jgi:hypothetical protein
MSNLLNYNFCTLGGIKERITDNGVILAQNTNIINE